ncbi:MAG: dNTP triphosphohydrolase [Bacteroidales bacterium]|nr:dNTP triphosphohydrolase [Bacteroidales bacterium]
MKWDELLTTRRTGQVVSRTKQSRTEFQRDYDRMIFSPAFRRLQNKTQVFPLPGSVCVHNRLTHSLEVASVGRSLGNNISRRLIEANEANEELASEIGSIVATACLAHDLGNPPFGHSGEKAISHYFQFGKGAQIIAENDMTEAQKQDLLNFDGNANTFRLLSHTFRGRREGGLALTFPSVASIIKYPRSSVGVKKFAYFQQDQETFEAIMQALNIPLKEGNTYCRYPLVYLVEAADDICYQLMDLEDACRRGILSYDQTCNLFYGFFDKETDKWFWDNKDNIFAQVTDLHERISYLRSVAIGKLVGCTTEIFWNNRDSILNGNFEGSLLKHLPEVQGKALSTIAKLAVEKIYRHPSVMEVEISGFRIISTLLDKFLEALMYPDRYYSGLLLPFVPEQFRPDENATTYDKAMAAVDIVSGMTDIYALDIYKKIIGEI